MTIDCLRTLLMYRTRSDGAEEQSYYRIRLQKSLQYIKMDYCYTEEPSISERLTLMDTSSRGNNLGLMNLYTTATDIAQNIFSIVFALFLLVGGRSIGIGLTWIRLLLTVVIFSSGMFSAFKMRSLISQWLEVIYRENAAANTDVGYYGLYIESQNVAKDIRIFSQQKIILKFCCTMDQVFQAGR